MSQEGGQVERDDQAQSPDWVDAALLRRIALYRQNIERYATSTCPRDKIQLSIYKSLLAVALQNKKDGT